MDSSVTRVGRLPECSVRAWLEEHQVTVARLPFILISTIDSNRPVADMPWAVAKGRSDPGWALSTSPLVISGSSTVELLDQNLFTGFDELWVPAQMPVTDPPDDANLVAPRALDVEVPPAVLAWLTLSGCRLGVGDGEGMNYVVRDSDLGSGLGLV